MKLLQDVNLGANIQRLRLQQHLTQVQVVAQSQILGSNFSETAYSKLEGGHRNIFITDLLRLKEIFGVEYNDFFADLSITDQN